MLNKDLISASIPVLSTSDSVDKALQLMADYHVPQLPVIDSNNKYLGMVSENELLNSNTSENLSQPGIAFLKLAAFHNRHFFEAIQLAKDYNLSIIPVITEDETWIGTIELLNLLKQFALISGISDPGGLIILEVEKHNFSFSEITKLVETNDAQVTQMNTCPDASKQNLIITLKVNKFEVSDIVNTFQRYEYHVKYYFGEELYTNELKSNYDHLMNYLNI